MVRMFTGTFGRNPGAHGPKRRLGSASAMLPLDLVD